MNQKDYNGIKKGTIDVFELLLFGYALIASSFHRFNIIGLYVVVPILVFHCFSRNGGNILAVKQTRLYLYLLIWIIITNLLGEDLYDSFSFFPAILASALISFCVFIIARNPNNFNFLCTLYVLFYLSLIIYLYTNGGLIVATYDMSEDDRAGGVSMNANNFSYYLPFFSFAIYFLFIEKNRRLLVDIIIFVLLALLSFIISLITASRQILFLQAPLLALLLFVKFFRYRRNLLFPVLLFFLITLVSIPMITSLYEDSFLAKRNELNLQDDPREYALHNAIKIGTEHIIFGVGTGNYINHDSYRQFTHNSYAELYACTGLMGVLLYTMIFLSFVLKQIKLYRKDKKNERLPLILVIIIFMFQNMFYVYYLVPWLMAFPFIIMGYSENLNINSKYKEE